MVFQLLVPPLEENLFFPSILTVNFYSHSVQASSIGADDMGEDLSTRLGKRSRRLSTLSGEAKVNLAVDMSSTVAALAIDSIRDQHPGMSRSKLLELARRRFRSGRAR
jgi:hypothetical protein